THFPYTTLFRSDWLTALALDVYDVTRITSTFATGRVSLTNTTGSPIVLTAGGVHLTTAAGAATYENTLGVTVPAGVTLSLDFTANLAGSIGSTGAATLTIFVTPVIGLTASKSDPF